MEEEADVGSSGSTTVNCRFEMPNGEECGDEIEVEWVTHYIPPKKSGRSVCIHCGAYEDEQGAGAVAGEEGDADEDFEGNTVEHRFEDEYEEVDEEHELISYKTWCWHPFTREQAWDALGDMAVAAAEKRAEEGRI